MSLYSAIDVPKEAPLPVKATSAPALYEDAPELVLAELESLPAAPTSTAARSSDLAKQNSALHLAPPRKRTNARTEARSTGKPIQQRMHTLPPTAPTPSFEKFASYDFDEVAEEYRLSRKSKAPKRAVGRVASTIDWRASYDPRHPMEMSDWLQSQDRLDELERWRRVKERRRRHKESPAPTVGLGTASNTILQPPRQPAQPASAHGSQENEAALPQSTRPAPSKKGFAARYMAAQGWKEGDGLGVQKQGRLAPLFVRAQKDGTAQVIDKDRARQQTRGSRVVLLKGLLQPDQAVDEMLQQDIGDACRLSYGPVERVQLDWTTQEARITFVTLESAAQCVAGIGTRRFWGELVSASFAI